MISVCGPNEATASEVEVARAIGRSIAEAGHAVICGGRGGVMEAVCAGAKSAGGTTIGILPGYDASAANCYVDHVICTGLGHARNAVVVASGDAVIAIGGGFGTLSEIGLALKMSKRVIHIESWDLDVERLARFGTGGAEYIRATDAAHAVALAVEGETARDRTSRL